MNKSKVPRIAVLVDTATGWGRRLIHGIILYSKKHGGWHVWVKPSGPDDKIRLPQGWHGDGIIARVSTPSLAENLQDKGPVVNVSTIRLKGIQFPSVVNDTQACANVAAEHFLDRGFQNFGYCSLVDREFVDVHRQAFIQQLEDRECSCEVYVPEKGCGASAAWEAQVQSLTNWLKRLPKPIAIFTWATQAGIEIINACEDAGIMVPEEVAVLGGDEDDLLCETCRPALSSLHVAAEQTGHEAAQMLDQLMQDEKLKESSIKIQPTGIVSRQSTEVLAIDDPDLATALSYIRTHPDLLIQVEDVARAASVSRRSLERRFLSVLGRTIHDEISRARLERAVDLLIRTEMPLSAIASGCGYGTPGYFSSVFKDKMGITPLKYRAKIQGR